MSLAILRIIEEESLKVNTSKVIAELPIPIATYLMNEKRNEVNSIYANNKVNIIIIPNAELESPKYKLLRYRTDNDETIDKSSYELIEKKIESIHEFTSDKDSNNSEATVKGINPSKPIPIRKSSMLAKTLKAIKISSLEIQKPNILKIRKTKNYNPNYKGKKFNKNYRPRTNKFSRSKNYANKKD